MKALIILSAFLYQPILAATPTEVLKSFRTRQRSRILQRHGE
ncbi:MAG: hypothetical protein ABGZ37_08350 [Akkermansiaceae bacterium]